MRLVPLLLTAVLLAAPARARTATTWDRLIVPPMKTSIYVGSVTLTPSAFVRTGDAYTATYNANVWPWFPWNESGSVTIRVPQADLDRVARGETVEFAGAGADKKGRKRTVSGRAVPADAHTGKLKLRIHVDGLDLIFNGTYKFGS